MATKASEEQHYTKYEKARIIGSRALQIASGAPFMVKLTDEEIAELNYNPIELAKIEFAKDAIPISIRRPLPQGKSTIKKKKEEK